MMTDFMAIAYPEDYQAHGYRLRPPHRGAPKPPEPEPCQTPEFAALPTLEGQVLHVLRSRKRRDGSPQWCDCHYLCSAFGLGYDRKEMRRRSGPWHEIRRALARLVNHRRLAEADVSKGRWRAVR